MTARTTSNSQQQQQQQQHMTATIMVNMTGITTTVYNLDALC